jgi:hypothetical protein
MKTSAHSVAFSLRYRFNYCFQFSSALHMSASKRLAHYQALMGHLSGGVNFNCGLSVTISAACMCASPISAQLGVGNR